MNKLRALVNYLIQNNMVKELVNDTYVTFNITNIDLILELINNMALDNTGNELLDKESPYIKILVREEYAYNYKGLKKVHFVSDYKDYESNRNFLQSLFLSSIRGITLRLDLIANVVSIKFNFDAKDTIVSALTEEHVLTGFRHRFLSYNNNKIGAFNFVTDKLVEVFNINVNDVPEIL